MSTPEHLSDLLSDKKVGGFWKTTRLPIIVVVALTIFAVSAAYVWAESYNGRMPPRSSIGDITLGGMTTSEAEQRIQERVDAILTTGITVVMNSQEKQLPLVTLVSGDLIEDVHFSINEFVDQLANTRHPNPILNIGYLLTEIIDPTRTTVSVELQRGQLTQSLLNLYPNIQTLSIPTTFDVTYSESEERWLVEAKEGEPGIEFQLDLFFSDLESQLSQLNGGSVELELLDVSPSVSKDEAQKQAEQVTAVLDRAPYVIAFTEDEKTWDLTSVSLATMLIPTHTETISLDADLFFQWFTTISEEVNQAAVNARLEVKDGRVTDFVESEEGREVDGETTYQRVLVAILSGKNKPINLAMVVEEPMVKTGDINDLGITEILGTGTSSYRGSPTNRRHNIQNGVDLLNGLLIAPGETFSLIEALRPFTYENGYLAELVIKGDKIEPELGGGLCQIGTTTFRATMNAGLPVTERQNHSLVVSYYNDPANGNPGTDATIYEPAPDYKFTNDTDHYILFQAENFTETQDLRFTFWGTSDGRKGTYEPPVVTRWIPVGATQYIETENLEPGVEQCQGAHIGADASFTYTVTHADGTIEETVYTSHYRPLPQICLIGVDPEVTEEDETLLDENLSEESMGEVDSTETE
ncbi:hypothetical protein CO174_02450 [Candidatus Uhrbacteria bacterium CG_4_9_14_3_um_filter_50_9]|uniref:Peptidoglycan binding domain-containing protein n=1 Tax=Candidatus Uhrbacteria bacterium CG_4_9_14_3_um_filter_50_9 TaxID=1975035 RepID=A0A2M7XCE0_9BACT|nr:MAG: hypothetical protein CO174_02450 [Candidatus Uhrbacteria bacterium CG_4_9_14_3_um_filter_50_9]